MTRCRALRGSNMRSRDRGGGVFQGGSGKLLRESESRLFVQRVHVPSGSSWLEGGKGRELHRKMKT